uniref:RING-type domain-containing protein n=1 Tax=Meloidogyne hapla TaxID=6305 RepID=A0A1I8BZH9_MELHA
MIVKKIRRNHWLSFRVIPKDNVKDFVVDWEDLSSSMIGNTENDFYQKTNKYFEKDGNDKLILKIEKIFHLIKEDYLTLSYVYQFMADVQSECLTKFLFKKYGRDYLIQIEALNKVQNEETAIQNKYKIKYKNKYYVYRLDTDKTIFTQQELPIERYDEKGEHTKEEEFRYKNLKKFVENNTFEFNQSFIEEYKNENNENKLECSICLLEFGIGDIVQMTKCNALFLLVLVELREEKKL